MLVLDFGIGDAQELCELGLAIKHVIGIDTSPAILEIASKNLAQIENTLLVGSVERMSKIDSGSMDLIVATNVLGYLTSEEESVFFSEAKRIINPKGYLLLTLANELFDLFALNSGTAEFFEKNFKVKNSSSLLIYGEEERFKNARRHNPLQLEAKLKSVNFSITAKSYSQWHHTPPILIQKGSGLTLREARIQSRDHALNPNDLQLEDEWRALFQCSIFGFLARNS